MSNQPGWTPPSNIPPPPAGPLPPAGAPAAPPPGTSQPAPIPPAPVPGQAVYPPQAVPMAPIIYPQPPQHVATPGPHQGYPQPPYSQQPYPQQVINIHNSAQAVAVAGYGGAGADKSVGVAYLLWFLVGFLGVHHFYLGKTGRGLLYLFTVGLFGFGLLVDLFTLPAQVKSVNAQRRTGVR